MQTWVVKILNRVAADVSPLHLRTGKKSEPTYVGCYGLSGRQIPRHDPRIHSPAAGARFLEMVCVAWP